MTNAQDIFVVSILVTVTTLGIAFSIYKFETCTEEHHDVSWVYCIP